MIASISDRGSVRKSVDALELEVLVVMISNSRRRSLHQIKSKIAEQGKIDCQTGAFTMVWFLFAGFKMRSGREWESYSLQPIVLRTKIVRAKTLDINPAGVLVCRVRKRSMIWLARSNAAILPRYLARR
jgi:hypothetical protein